MTPPLLYDGRMTVKELIAELSAYPPDLPVFVDGLGTPTFEMATIADFDVEASRQAEHMVRDDSTARRVLVILADDQREEIDVSGWRNYQPHFLAFDSEGGRQRT